MLPWCTASWTMSKPWHTADKGPGTLRTAVNWEIPWPTSVTQHHTLQIWFLFWPLPILGKSVIRFCSWDTHRANSITPSDRVIMKMTVSRGDLQFNMGSKPQWGPGMLHFPKVLSLADMNASVLEQKICTHIWQVSNPQHSEWGTTMPWLPKNK